MRALELKFPPPIVALVCAAIMYAATNLMPDLQLQWPSSGRWGAIVAFIGIALDLLGIFAFYRARTTVNPLNPSATSTIVQDGVYRYTRNPMYLGMLLVLLGFALYLAHPAAFVLLPMFPLYLTRFQIIPEERILREKFGQAYEAYASRVRRWI